MRFRGQILLPTESGPGLPVHLEVGDHRLALVSDSERLGAWPLDSVQVRRIGSDTFAMTVAGEDLHFIADDTISFAYTGLPAIERVTGTSTRTRFRSLRGRFGSRTPSSEVGEAVEPAPTTESTANREPSTPSASASHLAATAEPGVGVAEVATPPRADEDTPAMVIDLADGHPPAEREVAPEAEAGTCRALRQDGLPCRSTIIGATGYCHAHDPDRGVQTDFRKAQEARARLRRKGAARLTGVYQRLDRALRQVERGELDPETAMAMAQLARTMCAIVDLDGEPGDEDPVGV